MYTGYVVLLCSDRVPVSCMTNLYKLQTTSTEQKKKTSENPKLFAFLLASAQPSRGSICFLANGGNTCTLCLLFIC